MPKIKHKRSRREKRLYVDKWLKKYGLTRERIQSNAYIDGIGTLREDDYYLMAVGYDQELRANVRKSKGTLAG